MIRVTAARMLSTSGMGGPTEVCIEDGVIAAVRPASGPTPDLTLAPGFIDVQVNGVDDVDVSRATDGDAWDRLDRLVVVGGVTTWCPTVTSAPLPRLDAALTAIGIAGARPARPGRPHIAGAHVEGPFLGIGGAHRREHLRPVDHGWLASLPGRVRIVTIAPELAGAPEAVAALARHDVVVALGHTRATEHEMVAAIDAGATMVTHLFNAMTPLHHRDPGPVGVALTDDRVVAGLVADGAHVHPRVLRLAFAAKTGAGIAITTDATAWRSQPPDADVAVSDGAVRRRDGTLAGSAVTMAGAVANCVAAGVPLADALVAASTTPARLLGLDDRGTIEPGRRADLVALDHRLRPVTVWIDGEPVPVGDIGDGR